ncbi:uroporphyrinogen decarboxylase [Hathewaya proteolytica DSM 3090]|uniref:Uroporphyrinogen decarboxylase n=1 Tax=Hathewaya proteolytica DSM 3090 TaxID=1121331 RepID=A0A1M6MB83_9CLOT|nr:uroporphyrinogen decarboxylase family protein [Hathewaya proteolytica]SHJ80758.1 uroporphyrinogen decarboxylase [Hathewaya proteolytica DSM 3090]
MSKDLMTPLERSKAIAKGDSADRLPCNPNIANGVARIYGCKISEFNTSGKAIAEAQIASYRRFGYDGVRVFTDLFTWSEAMGAKVILPEDNTADLLEPAINEFKDMKELEEKIDALREVNPYKDGRLPVHVEAMKYLIDGVGTEVPCSGGVVGPFTNAFFLVGVPVMTKLMFKRPDLVHKLCEISLKTCINYTEAILSCGLTPTISEPMSSCTVVSPKHFREFSLPYLRRLIEYINSKGKGVTIHICGKTDPIWEDLVESKITGLSIDNIADLEQCKKQVGDRVKIMGNVEPATVMYGGTPTEIRKSVIDCVSKCWDSPKGYVIMSGCSLPVETPLENIQAMMDAAREIGYPVTEEKLHTLLQK